MSAIASEALARRLAALADSKKAEDIVVLDMRELVAYTDFLIDLHRPQRAPGAGDRRRGAGAGQGRDGPPAGRRRRRRRSGLGRSSTTSTASCTSSPSRPASATSSRISGVRRRAWSWISTRPRHPRRPAPERLGAAARRLDACVTKCRPRAPLRCRAWEASSGLCSATAAPMSRPRSRLAKPEISGLRQTLAQQLARLRRARARRPPRSRGW